MELTKEILRNAMPYISDTNIDKYLPWLNKYMPEYEITTPERISMFLAQIGHETASFRYYRELSSGQQYEGRKSLGNTEPGDGPKFKGRGCIQITGRANYTAFSREMFGDDRFVEHPEQLELPEFGMLAACWFWRKHKLNELSDAKDVKAVTKKINGGTTNLADRTRRWKMAYEYISKLNISDNTTQQTSVGDGQVSE